MGGATYKLFKEIAIYPFSKCIIVRGPSGFDRNIFLTRPFNRWYRLKSPIITIRFDSLFFLGELFNDWKTSGVKFGGR